MNRLLFILLLLCSVGASAQTGYLFVKKAYKKKRTYTEGDHIVLRLKDGRKQQGLITQLRNDTIFLSGKPVPAASVKTVLLEQKNRRFDLDAKTFLLITGGVALTTAGLSLSNQASFEEALTAGLVIGYGPLLIAYIRSKISLKRKQYRIGKKFHLQVLDFHLPHHRGF
ncbi:MAG: hypothetical protein ABW019_04420 [Chitinophagaceae bacterium]